MRELIPEGARGLDAGCGSGARDVFFYWQLGYDVVGFDAVDENIRVAKELHPEIAEKVSVADLSKPLQHPDESFDFVMCNAVIQHIAPDLVASVTLPELTRVLKPGGVLQLMFKVGDGIKTLYDKDYDAERTFQLYSADDVVSSLTGLGCEIIPQVGEKLGGLMYFTDPKPADHCLLFALKSN
jgi:ubiquinone/menaquinone biosynthesis C-methylase UbiE